MKKLITLREPVNGLTHLFGALLGLIGAWWLIESAFAESKSTHVLAFSIYGASLVALYLSSALYHLLNVSEKTIRILRRIDHIMIFVFIAGTYTPVCLVALRGNWGWELFLAIWGIALIGIILKTWYLHAPRWISVAVYLSAGWLAILAIVPLFRALPAWGLGWIFLGGIFYSGGAIIYAMKKPNPYPGIFGFHEIWHLCVMAGSACHYYLMWQYILPIG